MKKNLMVMSVLFMALITLTGCGGKKLTCTKTEGENSAKIVYEFKGDSPVKATSESTEVYDTEDEAKQAKAMIDAVKGLAGSQDYMKIDAEQKGKKVITKISLDVTKMTDEEKEEELSKDATYDSLKKDAEEDGFTCK